MKLPDPTLHAQKHSEQLTAIIRQEIEKSQGFITFARYMELALYAPAYGYYNAPFDIFGARGDFVTAPEISPLFARCIAKQCQQILREIQQGNILEIGAGSGIFAKDLLHELTRLNALPDQYFILETSEHLRRQQQTFLQQHCPGFYERIIWVNASLPTDFRGIIFANEVLDALPIHRFKMGEQAIQEQCVTWENNQFHWIETEPTSPLLAQKLVALQNEFHFPEGYISEINIALEAWLCALAPILQQGIILLFDYGYGRPEYYHPDRQMGTFMCHYQHHRHDNPFTWPGLQDMTAHVDFTRVIEVADQCGFHLSGFTTQSSFLLATDIMAFAEQNAALLDHYHQAQSIKKLLLPSEMGEIIKTMALSKNVNIPLMGFTLYDRRGDLAVKSSTF